MKQILKASIGIAVFSIMAACNKPEKMPETPAGKSKTMSGAAPFSTNEGDAYGISIRNGMLSFSSAALYAEFASLTEEEILSVLRPYEQTGDLTSLAELYPVRSDEGKEGLYGAVISSLLNGQQLIEIAGKVFRVNAASGKVYMLASEALTEANLADLVRENIRNTRIEERSVDEDLFELLGSMRTMAGPGTGCPQTGQNITDRRSTVHALCPADGGGSGHFDIEAKYRRYGVYFELFAVSTGVAFNANSPYAGCFANYLQCSPATYKRNSSSSQFTENATYIYPGYGKKNWYNGAYRLCYFYIRARTTYNGHATPWTANCIFNYTP